MEVKHKNYKNKLISAGATFVICALLFLLFYFTIFRTPIPPWPQEGGGGGGNGLEINIGNSEDGAGNDQYAEIGLPDFAEQEKKTTHSLDAGSSDNILTQDGNEETATVTEIIEKNKEENKNREPNAEKHANSETHTAQPKVNPSALYKKSKNTSDGTTGREGNQGSEDGSANAKNYGGTGSGSGTGTGSGTGSGSGSGSGTGSGTGIGGGKGNGISYDLGGRGIKALQTPTYNSKEQGKVVVSIKVNRDGKVTYAAAGAKGTTVSEVGLRRQAENAALRTTFAKDPNAPMEQRGTITYVFKKQN